VNAHDLYISVSTADRSTSATWGSRQPPPRGRNRKENTITMVATTKKTSSRRQALARLAAGGALAAVTTLPALHHALAASPKAHTATKTLTIGAKGFPENEIVANMYLLLLQHAGIPVNSQLKVLASQVATPALQKGALDIYPEYTGTGLEAILGKTAAHTSSAYYNAVKAGYQSKYKLTWLTAYPMNDTQGFATTVDFSRKNGIASIADMVKKASSVRLIVATEYLSRADGLPGVKKVYGDFTPKALVKLQDVGSVRYAALLHGQGDVTEAFTTDPDIAAHHLVVLSDPKGYAPPDNLAPVVRDDALQAYPKLASTLNVIAPKITTAVITGLSNQVVSNHDDPQAVAKSFLQQQGLLK